jgi:predicted DNA binding CopG/RHH family protein
MIDYNTIKLDDEEMEIEETLESYLPLSREESDALIDRAVSKKQLTLRLFANDIEAAKKLAEREGLPYQTFISSVLHKYVTGKLVDLDEARKLLRGP